MFTTDGLLCFQLRSISDSDHWSVDCDVTRNALPHNWTYWRSAHVWSYRRLSTTEVLTPSWPSLQWARKKTKPIFYCASFVVNGTLSQAFNFHNRVSLGFLPLQYCAWNARREHFWTGTGSNSTVPGLQVEYTSAAVVSSCPTTTGIFHWHVCQMTII